MSKEDFRKLLSQWANEDAYIGQLTWEEGDALAERLANWYASQQSFAADASPDRPLEEHEFNAWHDDPGLY